MCIQAMESYELQGMAPPLGEELAQKEQDMLRLQEMD